MKHLNGQEAKHAEHFIDEAAKIAKNSSCQRAKCGCIIVKDEKIIGQGFNSPPGGLESQRRCVNDKDKYHKKITDKTCCVHAEQRAIMDALRSNPEKIIDSKLYFIRLGDDGKKAVAGKPYCTHCSKLALDSGIKEFVLWHEDGIAVYDTEEYKEISFNYQE